MDFLELPAQVRVFFTKPAGLERAIHNELQLFDQVFRLDDVIERAHLQGLNGSLSAGECSEEDELPVEAGIAELPQEVDAGHIRHPDVGNNEIEFGCLYLGESFLDTGCASDGEALLLQENFEHFANRPFIIDDQYLGSFGHFRDQ